ncbi:hypothetical protein Dimus_012469 [Dionaea muscipula]
MELEVVGRHALLFDDDATAGFVNSKEALVEWNSLSIDRYDVRHLLSNPPSSFRKHRHQSAAPYPSPDSHLDSELDLERYADLPPSPSYDESADNEVGAGAAQYAAVPFSYGSATDSSDQMNAEVDPQNTGFHPPFPVPKNLLQNLPPTEKVHQIIARTAMFVSKHGGQSEIVLRVKQGDNPSFGFLMPHHHLHPYFRYLVNHQELLKISIDGNSHRDNAEDNRTDSVGAGGALSLLGSVYGSVEDEDGVAEGAEVTNQKDSFDDASAAGGVTSSQQSVQPNSGGRASQKDETVSKGSHVSKDNALPSSTTRISNAMKTGTAGGKKKESGLLSSSHPLGDKAKASAVSSISKVEMPVIEPSSDLKRLVDRIVEIILKNGKEFETVLVEQDKTHGRFEFLLPSHRYHPYYLKVLQRAQESKKIHKSVNSQKDGSSWQVLDKKTLGKESGFMSPVSAIEDLPLEYDRKEKFKMVIGKSKKDVLDQPSKGADEQHGVGVDAAAAGAILQAATRGIKNPNLAIFFKSPFNGSNQLAGSGVTGQASSFGNLQSFQPECSFQKKDEENSSEAGMTREQKLKAERLKRAKMFAAMIKSGAAAAPSGKEKEPLLRGLSAEPHGSGISASNKDMTTQETNKVDGSLFPDDGNSEKSEKPEGKDSGDESGERQSRKRRHYRSRRNDDDNKEEEEDDDKERRHSRKKHRSHRSSHQHRDRSKDRHKHHHRKRHSSSKSKEFLRVRRHDDVSSDDDDDERRHRHHKHDDSSEDEDKDNNRRKNNSSLKDEKRHWKRSSKHDVSREDDDHRHHKLENSTKDDENGHERRHIKRRKRTHSEEGDELEEGEISVKSSDQSPPSGAADGPAGEASVDDVSNANQDTEVPDDLRAKIRAMLLATL